MPRITWEAFKCIKEGLLEGKTQRVIADECNVSLATVNRYAKIIRGREVEALPLKIEDDVRFIIETVRKRLDPRHPIMMKWIDNVSWWTHLILDFGKLVLPDILRLLNDGDIDIHNPELTAKNVASKFKMIEEIAREHEKKIKDLEDQIKTLEKEKSRLEAEKRAYEKALTSLSAKVDELERRAREIGDKIERTLKLIIGEVPKALPKEAREIYISFVYPEVEKIWS